MKNIDNLWKIVLEWKVNLHDKICVLSLGIDALDMNNMLGKRFKPSNKTIGLLYTEIKLRIHSECIRNNDQDFMAES